MYVYADKNKTEGIDRTYGALDGLAVYGKEYIRILEVHLLLGFEYAKVDEQFQYWSINVNGVERESQGQIVYYKDASGNIQYIPEFIGLY